MRPPEYNIGDKLYHKIDNTHKLSTIIDIPLKGTHKFVIQYSIDEIMQVKTIELTTSDPLITSTIGYIFPDFSWVRHGVKATYYDKISNKYLQGYLHNQDSICQFYPGRSRKTNSTIILLLEFCDNSISLIKYFTLINAWQSKKSILKLRSYSKDTEYLARRIKLLHTTDSALLMNNSINSWISDSPGIEFCRKMNVVELDKTTASTSLKSYNNMTNNNKNIWDKYI